MSIAASDEGDQSARLAYEVFVYRIQTNVAAMCAAMEGTDGLVFTGGAGEASARLRADVWRPWLPWSRTRVDDQRVVHRRQGSLAMGRVAGGVGCGGSGGSRGRPSCAPIV